MKTLEEEIKDQKETVFALNYLLEGVHDSYLDVANRLDDVRIKHATELKHLKDLENILELRNLRDDNVAQLKGTK